MSRKAYDSWKLLAGIVCAYKPPNCSAKYVTFKLKNIICKELNSLETRPQRHCLMVDRSGGEVSVSVQPSYADHVLCVGPRYQPEQIHTSVVSSLGDISSGVLLVCLNCGNDFVNALRRLSFTKCFHLKGVLGLASLNYHTSGKVIGRAKYHKVTRERFENVLASCQSALHRRMFEEYGVPLESQEAYNLAVKGLYRPVWNGPTVLYSMKIVEFEPPDFTIEVNCFNETELYLMNLVHNLGVSLRCYATCTGIRCLRHGCFHVEHSLVKNQLSLDNIIENVKLTWDILEKNYPKTLKYSPEVTTSKPSSEMLEVPSALKEKSN